MATPKKFLSERRKLGRPTLWNENIKKAILNFAELGYTDKEIAGMIGIDEKTLTNWKKEYPDFFLSLKEAKKRMDSTVERALFKRAMGYSAPEIKFATHEGVITDEKEYIRHYPPDATSLIFWLKNRQPDRWRDKSELAVNDTNKEFKLAYKVNKKTDE